jgi:hypothetical protein
MDALPAGLSESRLISRGTRAECPGATIVVGRVKGRSLTEGLLNGRFGFEGSLLVFGTLVVIWSKRCLLRLKRARY